MRNLLRLSPFFVILVFLLSGATPPTEVLKPEAVELKGTVVCLAEEMRTHYNVELFKTHEHLYGVKTEAGKYYTLLRTSLAEALFVDERLHEKDCSSTDASFLKRNCWRSLGLPLSRMVWYTNSTTTAIHATSARLHPEIATAVKHPLC